MRLNLLGRCASWAICAAFLASPASATLVNWDIDASQSFFKLAIADQTVSIGTLTATMRLRNQNNAAWTTNTAPVDGILATDVGAGISSIEFLGGQSALFGANTGNYRPNPAAFNTAATSTLNTAGSYSNTSAAPAVFGARVNASVSIATLNIGYIGFSNVSYDFDSVATAVTGTSFLTSGIDLGILDSTVAFDGIVITLFGQQVGDGLGPTGSITDTNVNGAAGSILDQGGGVYKLTVPVSMPVFVDLAGVQLNAVATGLIVGYATIVPEPATLALVAVGLLGMGMHVRRRRS